MKTMPCLPRTAVRFGNNMKKRFLAWFPEDKLAELDDIVTNKRPLGRKLYNFLRENHLLFAATDRSVLNLPAMAKKKV